jgi:hypothetical protein
MHAIALGGSLATWGGSSLRQEVRARDPEIDTLWDTHMTAFSTWMTRGRLHTLSGELHVLAAPSHREQASPTRRGDVVVILANSRKAVALTECLKKGRSKRESTSILFSTCAT